MFEVLVARKGAAVANADAAEAELGQHVQRGRVIGEDAGAQSINIVAVPFARRFPTGSGPVSVMPGDALTATLSPQENSIAVLPAR